MGVYHQLDLQTQQSVWIILSPLPASLAEARLKEGMQSDFGASQISTSPFNLHAILISCYISNWREFCTYYERGLEELSGKVMTINLDSDVDISHATLRRANGLKQKLLPLQSIFTSLNLVLNNLETTIKSTQSNIQTEQVIKILHNLRNELSAHAENSKYLIQFSDRIRIQTSDTLNLKNQDISKQHNGQLFRLAQSSARDSLSIRVITIVTLVYLPFSFVAEY
ncbi:hypothetical protein N0V90_002064 [Kalmusia sp. IMI 367209]|nr:hypothetical protein N0V90_002064 [Kalmusia sp. IMI 367209]